MAASDQHYRNQKTLDTVFGASCGLMLLTTLWMLAADYYRDFKGVQRQFRDVEATLAERDMVDRIPDPKKVDEGLHAVRLARVNVSLAKGEAVKADVSAPQAKFNELKAFRLDELDPDNRARLERRLAALEASPALTNADAAFLAAERRILGQRERADENYRGVKASLDAETSYYNIDVDDAGKPENADRHDALLASAGRRKERLDRLDAELAKWKAELDRLDYESRQLRAPVAVTEKVQADREDELKKLNSNFDRYAKLAASKAWTVGDTIRTMPILDGFQSPTKINQIWLPDLTIDYGGFRDVPRYDRCTTCHLGIDRGTFERAMLGKLGDDDESKRLTTKLAAAKDQLEKRASAGEKLGYSPGDLPGERQGSLGFITVLLVLSSLVAAGTLGALERSWKVGLNTLFVGLGLTLLTGAILAFSAPVVPKVKSIKLTEGQVTQYCAHPRLDLYVDSNSPHPIEKFGCTTCHAGQGSATDFGLAVHSPNDAIQEDQWRKGYGWAASHNWDFPMLPKRFTESGCLKCHHQVSDLVSKGSKEEAPKLMKGHSLVRELGCFGCHEIQGTKGGRAIGPDVRAEPAPALEYLSAADQDRAKSDPANPPGTYRKVGPSLRRLAEKVSEEWTRKWLLSPRGFREDTKMPHFYGLSTNSADVLPEDQKAFPRAEIASISYYLLRESKDSLSAKDFNRRSLTEGQSSLTAMQEKLGKGGLSDKDMKDLFDVSKRFSDLALLSNPMASRVINAAALRQRQLQERLGEVQRRAADLRNRGATDADLKPVLDEMVAPSAELASVTKELVTAATPVKISDRLIDGNGDAVTLPAEGKGDAKNGRVLFTERGCLACHAHEGTTKSEKTADGKTIAAVRGEANFGPELSRIAEKLSPAADKTSARGWLVQWLLNPNVYHPRTRMPVTHLSVEQANDVATWLLAQKSESKAIDPGQPTTKELIDLARVYFAKAPGITKKEVEEFLPAGEKLKGIPFDRVGPMPREADERALAEGGDLTPDSLKWYIGKKAIGRLGCYGCHDVPGFETAKPIGVGLNDWGKKDNDRIAFEDGEAYARAHYHVIPTAPKDKVSAEERLKALKGRKELSKLEDHEKHYLEELTRVVELEKKDGRNEAEEKELEEGLKHLRESKKKPPYEEAFFEALEHHHREGFLHLKLLEPRSYDYNRIKAWDDRLRMPQFQFGRSRQKRGETEAEYIVRSEKEEADGREAVMTFVLGLVAEPVPLKYVHTPKAEKAAEVAGRQVLDKYNCASCHQIRPGVYEFKMTPDVQARLQSAFDKASLEDQANWLKDHVYSNHSAWYGPQQSGDRMAAFGYLDKEATAKADESRKEGDAAVDFIYLTDALRFTGNDRAGRDLRAGMSITLPRGSYEASAPYGGTLVDLLTNSPGKSRNGNDLPSYMTAKDSTNYPAAEPGKARGVLPPPLVREGERVQPDWLYKFLLNPGVVRPQEYMLLRMPKFNMSPEESRALVNYFAAVSKTTNPGAGVTYPYVTVDQRDAGYWKHLSEQYAARSKAAGDKARADLAKETDAKKKAELQKLLDGIKDRTEPGKDDKGGARDPYSRAAFQLLTDKNLCISCHNIGSIVTQAPKAPNLALGGERLRPEWTEKWIANPKRLFTYSPLMPQNFPNATTPVEWQFQDLFVGSPLEQSRAARDLIMDTARLNELVPTYKAPPPTPPAGDKK